MSLESDDFRPTEFRLPAPLRQCLSLVSTGSCQSREPSLTVGLLNGSEAQLSSPRVTKGSASTQRLMGLWRDPAAIQDIFAALEKDR